MVWFGRSAFRPARYIDSPRYLHPSTGFGLASIIAVLLLALGGCTSFRLGEAYDQAIDDGLNDFQKSTVAFIKSMELNAGAAKGSYVSDESRKYYASAASSLSNMQMRAALLSSRTCPVATVVKYVQPLTDALEANIASAEKAVGLTSGPTETPDLSGNCMVLILRDLQLAEADLERDHKNHGEISIVVGEINKESIEGAVRVALEALRANKF